MVTSPFSRDLTVTVLRMVSKVLALSFTLSRMLGQAAMNWLYVVVLVMLLLWVCSGELSDFFSG